MEKYKPKPYSQNSHQNWMPLLDYSARYGVSLSTLRRKIKLKKIEFRLYNGRYFVEPPARRNQGPPIFYLTKTIQVLEKDLIQAKEEIAELKTLLAYYEEHAAPDTSS